MSAIAIRIVLTFGILGPAAAVAGGPPRWKFSKGQVLVYRVALHTTSTTTFEMRSLRLSTSPGLEAKSRMRAIPRSGVSTLRGRSTLCTTEPKAAFSR